MSTMSSSLRDESLKYRKAARQINIDAMIRKWAPYVPCMLCLLDTRARRVTDVLSAFLCH